MLRYHQDHFFRTEASMRSFHQVPDRVVTFAVAAVLAGCGVPERIPLPAPVPLTQGGTVVPSHGAGLGVDFGDGFLGQELLRTEFLALGLIGGLGDRVGAALYSFNETRENNQGGTFIRMKVRAGPLLGPKSSVAAAFAYSTSSRVSGGLQDERVTTLDLAIPAERLLAASADGWHELSAYLGPRIIFENYEDRLTPQESLEATHVGMLAGMHGRAGRFHLFGELNFLQFPGRVVRGQSYDGGWMVIPSLGVALHFGPSHRWGK
jgi:hypothetical protein